MTQLLAEWFEPADEPGGKLSVRLSASTFERMDKLIAVGGEQGLDVTKTSITQAALNRFFDEIES